MGFFVKFLKILFKPFWTYFFELILWTMVFKIDNTFHYSMLRRFTDINEFTKTRESTTFRINLSNYFMGYFIIVKTLNVDPLFILLLWVSSLMPFGTRNIKLSPLNIFKMLEITHFFFPLKYTSFMNLFIQWLLVLFLKEKFEICINIFDFYLCFGLYFGFWVHNFGLFIIFYIKGRVSMLLTII